MLDEVQKAVVSPYMPKGKKAQSILPSTDDTKDKPVMVQEEKDRFDDILGVNRHGKKE